MLISKKLIQTSKFNIKRTFNQSQRYIAFDIKERYFVVNYKYIDDIANKQGEKSIYSILNFKNNLDDYIDEHRKHVNDAEKKGYIILGTSTVPKKTTSLLIFNCKDEKIPYNFVKAVDSKLFLSNNIKFKDPIYKNGLLTTYTIEEIEFKTVTERKELANISTFR